MGFFDRFKKGAKENSSINSATTPRKENIVLSYNSQHNNGINMATLLMGKC